MQASRQDMLDALYKDMCRHDAGNPGTGKYIAFGHRAVADHFQCLRLHADDGLCGGLAARYLLFAHVDHAGFTFFIDVG